jgi:uncharacterized protein YndB with AHSA1/START domain
MNAPYKIFFEKTYPVSKQVLWEKWTDSTQLKSFFGLENKIEAKVGGAFEIYFLLDAPEGFRGSEGCKFLELVPFEKIRFSWNTPPNFEEIRKEGPNSEVMIELEVLENNQTKLKLTHSKWPNDPKYIPIVEYFEKAWEYVLNNLSKTIESERK